MHSYIDVSFKFVTTSIHTLSKLCRHVQAEKDAKIQAKLERQLEKQEQKLNDEQAKVSLQDC